MRGSFNNPWEFYLSAVKRGDQFSYKNKQLVSTLFLAQDHWLHSHTRQKEALCPIHFLLVLFLARHSLGNRGSWSLVSFSSFLTHCLVTWLAYIILPRACYPFIDSIIGLQLFSYFYYLWAWILPLNQDALARKILRHNTTSLVQTQKQNIFFSIFHSICTSLWLVTHLAIVHCAWAPRRNWRHGAPCVLINNGINNKTN